MRIILITGISGSGKSVALNALEDVGYFCVDNLPPRLLPQLAACLVHDGYERLAVAIDARSSASFDDVPQMLHDLAREYDVRLLFLNASTQALIQRFSETRRRHPLSGSSAHDASVGMLKSLEEAIEHERELVSQLAQFGHQVDTSNLSANALRAWVKTFVEKERGALALTFESFGFKRGVPLDADFVFDARMLPNPYYDFHLRLLTGLDQPVIDFLDAQPIVHELIEDIYKFVARWLPHFRADNRSYLTIAVGCTGGQHRSVYIAQALGKRFASESNVIVRHRDAQLDAAQSARLIT